MPVEYVFDTRPVVFGKIPHIFGNLETMMSIDHQKPVRFNVYPDWIDEENASLRLFLYRPGFWDDEENRKFGLGSIARALRSRTYLVSVTKYQKENQARYSLNLYLPSSNPRFAGKQLAVYARISVLILVKSDTQDYEVLSTSRPLWQFEASGIDRNVRVTYFTMITTWDNPFVYRIDRKNDDGSWKSKIMKVGGAY